MATTTIKDLPSSRALDYKARLAIRGAAGPGYWCLYAFDPFHEIARILPIVNFYQTNYIADNLTVQNQNISVKNSAPGATIAVGAVQNALTLNVVPA